jgi:hypothetical protein
MKRVIRWFIAVLQIPVRIPGWIIRRKQHVAVAMAIAAVLAAAAAFRAAVAEHDVSRLERKLDQGQMLELMIRQDLLDRFAQFPRFRDSYDLHIGEGQNRQREADGVRLTDSDSAAVLDLESQQEFAIARSLAPFVHFAQANLDPDNLEKSADTRVRAQLRHIGFETFPPDQPDPSGTPPSLWTHLKTQIDKKQSAVLRLTRSGVAFVLGLVFLTFAQLFRHHARSRIFLVWVGYLVVISGLINALWRDPDSSKTFGWFALEIPVFLGIGWMLSASVREWESLKNGPPIIRWIGERIPNWMWSFSERVRSFFHLTDDDEEAAEEPMSAAAFGLGEGPIGHMHVGDSMQPTPRLRRTVLALLALTALLSAVNGSFYSRATVMMSKAESEAIATQVDQIKNSSLARTRAYNLLESLATAQESRIRYFADLQRSQDYPLARAAMSLRQVGSRENKRWRGVRSAQGKLELLEGPLGPDRDPDFPQQLVLGELTKQRETSFARWDGENEISLAWRNDSIAYLRSLTLFAIALYLFGQSLSMGQTRAAFTLAFWAVILMGNGEIRALWTIHQSNPPDESAVREAASHYGSGRQLYETANTKQDYANAVEQLQQAVDARPKFALANFYLSEATTILGTPQVGGGYISLQSKDSLESTTKQEANAKQALDLQNLSVPSSLLTDHSWDKVLLAFSKGDRRYLDDSIPDARTVVDEYSDDPVHDFNLGLILLANGKKKDRKEAIETRYGTGLAGLVDEKDDSFRAGMAAAGITDLQLLRDDCKDLGYHTDQCGQIAATVDAIKKCFVLATWVKSDKLSVLQCATNAVDPLPTQQDSKAASSLLSQLELVASPSGLGWRGLLGEDVDRDRDILTVLWYAKDEDWGTWWVLPQVSGNVDLKAVKSRSEDDRKVYDFESYLENSESSGAHTCLPGAIDSHGKNPNALYRAEFYLNGKLLGPPIEIPLAAAQYVPAVARSIDLAVCYPENWRPWQMPDGSDGGFARGYVHPDGDRGVFLFSFFNLSQGREQNLDPATTQKFVQKAQSFLVSKGFATQSPLTPMLVACTNFPAKPGVAWSQYEGKGESLLSKAWVGEEGMVHVGLVFHRAADAAASTSTSQDPPHSLPLNKEDCGVLASLTITR